MMKRNKAKSADEKPMMSLGAKIFNISICLISIAILITYVLWTDGTEHIWETISNIHIGWLLAAFACMILYWVMENDVLHLLLKKMHPPQKAFDSFKVTMSGQFFNCVTPFSSGGQPFQAYRLMKQGVPGTVVATALLSKFIIYQSVLTVISTLVLIFRFRLFAESVNNFVYVTFIGFAVNSVIMVFLLMLAFFRRPTEAMITWGIRVLAKLKILKQPEQTIAKLQEELGKFYENFRFLKTNWKIVFRAALVTFVQLIAYFSISYMVYRAFGCSGESILTMICAQAFILMITSFVPLPGAAGATEGSFYLFFQMFFPEAYINIALLFWRMITYYFPIAAGAIFAIIPDKQRVNHKDEIRMVWCEYDTQGFWDARKIRTEVFVQEQGFNADTEFDATDKVAQHLVLYQGAVAKACARMYCEENGDWHLGRIAVLRSERSVGLGSRLLAAAEQRAKEQGATCLKLGSQQDKSGFYAKNGYCVAGEVYMEEFCPHVPMEKAL